MRDFENLSLSKSDFNVYTIRNIIKDSQKMDECSDD